MNILAIETTGPYCSVCILDNEETITEVNGSDRLSHLKSLVPMIEEALAQKSMTPKDIDVIAVSEGPGSFTGLRIGVTTARALSQATGIPVMTIPTLYAFGCGECDSPVVVCPLLDARRKQVYAGAYFDYQEILEGAPYLLADFLEELEGLLFAGQLSDGRVLADLGVLFVGDGAVKYREDILAWAEEAVVDAAVEETFQSAGPVAEFCLDNFDEEALLTYDEVEPEYMRIPEAERNRLAKEKGVSVEEANAGFGKESKR